MLFFRIDKLLPVLLGASLAAGLSTSNAQTYVYAPDTPIGPGWVAGWMSNRPEGTLEQDWYPGSTEDSTGTGPISGDTHDPTFLSGTLAQRFGGGLTAAPDLAHPDFQVISGLTANSAEEAVLVEQYIEFPFTTGTMLYADSTPSEALFYFNAAVTLKRWNLNENSHPRAFGYAAYIVDSSGSPVGGPIQQVDDVTTITGTDYHPVYAPDGPGPGITLQPGTAYALRFYLYRTAANTDGRAAWDDTLFAMSRQTLAEIVVTATTVSTTPSGGQTNYSYTFNVYNNGPDDTTANISNPLPGTANGSSATWTCILQPSGNACATPSGTGPISTTEPLTSGETAVYEVSWTGPAVTATDTHTITALPTEGSPSDPIGTNNSASIRLAPATVATPVPTFGWPALIGLASLVGMFGMKRARRRNQH